MFKRFFGRNDEEDEEKEFESIDPILEQRRKEKFSAPLIYNDEAPIVEEKKVEEKKTKPIVQNKKTYNEIPYEMTQIISPMMGVQKEKKSEIKPKPKMKKKPIKESDELIPVISPFFGPSERKEDTSDTVVETTSNNEKKDLTVTQNLRNIAQIAEEEKNQLKIIEERTGEFKLDLQTDEKDSFIDEIDDSMSLDELMNLYEKKFKD